MFDTTAWLMQNADGYSELTLEETTAIETFTLIWSLFEAQVLNRSASGASIVNRCRDLEGTIELDESKFADSLTYFQDRYSEKGVINRRFFELNFRRNDRKELVEKVILGEDASVSEKLAACLIIVYRFRNNYFHGTKWAYKFRDQLENFQHACKLLAYMMDLQRGSIHYTNTNVISLP